MLKTCEICKCIQCMTFLSTWDHETLRGNENYCNFLQQTILMHLKGATVSSLPMQIAVLL